MDKQSYKVNLVPPQAILKRIPKIKETEKQDDPIVWVKYFNPYGAGTWLVTEFDGHDEMFGLVKITDSELGYFSLRELQSLKHPMGFQQIERELHWVPKPLSEARRMEHMASILNEIDKLACACEEKEAAGEITRDTFLRPEIFKTACDSQQAEITSDPTLAELESMMEKIATRSLSEIAREIYADKANWRGGQINYAAKPYLEAMSSLKDISDNYMYDTGSSVVAYFLANAQAWRGDKAKTIKKELNAMLKASKRASIIAELDDVMSRFEEGKPADPTENMSEEDKKKWDEYHGKVDKLANLMTELKDDLDRDADYDPGKVLYNDPENDPSEGSLVPGMEPRRADYEEGVVINNKPQDDPSEGSETPGSNPKRAKVENFDIEVKDPNDQVRTVGITSQGKFFVIYKNGLKSTYDNKEKFRYMLRNEMNLTNANDLVRKLVENKKIAIEGKFEEGKPADPTENMSEEDAAEWKKQKEENKDNFKEAGANKWVVVKSQGFDDVVMSNHNNETAALTKAEKLNNTIGKSYSANPFRVVEIGPKTPYEIIELFGKQVLRQKTARERLTWDKTATKAPTGLYGFTRGIQSACEGCAGRLNKYALKLAKTAFNEDEQVAPFLVTHSKRAGSLPAKVLVAAMQNIGPQIPKEPETSKEAAVNRDHGLYGFKAKTAARGLAACQALRIEAGHIATDLHKRKADHHGKITSFLKTHAKEAKDIYAQMLYEGYPEASMKFASEQPPSNVNDWLAWEE